MLTNDKGLALIKSFEGLRLKAYQDQAGVWTVGYGHIRGVRPDAVCTEAEAELFLKTDLNSAESAVHDLVKVELTSNEFSALVSFVFNLGKSAFAGSTLLKKLNAGDYLGAAKEFKKWNKIRIKGKLTPSKGLDRRRAAEAALFLTKE